jgi:hypothetical protein
MKVSVDQRTQETVKNSTWGSKEYELMITRVDRIKPAGFDGSMSWTLFHHEFKVVAEHNSWVDWGKTTHLLAVLQGQATNFLHNVPIEASCDDIIEALRGLLQGPPTSCGILFPAAS